MENVDFTIGGGIRGIILITVWAGMMYILCAAFIMIISSVFRMNAEREDLMHSVVVIIVIGIIIFFSRNVDETINEIIFGYKDPTDKQRTFTKIYDNMSYYYSYASGIPLIKKIGNTIIFLFSTAGTIKGAYEIYEFFLKKNVKQSVKD